MIDFIKPLVILFLISTRHLAAQDTVSLKSLVIVAEKNNLSQLGKKSETIDSTIKQQFKFNSVGDVLGFNSPVFIKSYGPGALATTAFRGGNASQTAVLWNGFNIQNAMLGQSDLALMPSVLFEDVTIEYGGSSSLWGSGAVGGSIRLNNNNPFNKGLVTTTNLGAGSFGLLNGSTNILISQQRFVSSTKIYDSHAENNFKYKDTLDKENPFKNQKHGGYDFKGLMQEFKFLLNSKQILIISAWANDNQRSLPGLNTGVQSRAYQRDGALRLTGNWSYNASRFKSVIRGGWLNDKIDYTDSAVSTFSKSRVQTVMLENENYFKWAKNQQLNGGVNFSSSSAASSNYDKQRSMSRVSFLIGNKSSFCNNRLITYFSARAEYFSVGTLPVTGNIGAECFLTKNITAKINTARVYRQPTLNDLYWVPGGNIHLKPEQGYTIEGEINYKKEINRLIFYVSGAAYSRSIDNWILWIPGSNANPSPINIQRVWSRGTETTWKVSYAKNKLKLGLNLITAYVLSTTAASSQENNNTLTKQLIYTPRYTVNANCFVAYNRIGIFFFHQYVGYRFTTSDNSQWLPPYHVSTLKFNYNLPLKQLNLALFASCNNLFDNNYNIVAARPMPLRNFEIGITIQTRNKQ